MSKEARRRSSLGVIVPLVILVVLAIAAGIRGWVGVSTFADADGKVGVTVMVDKDQIGEDISTTFSETTELAEQASVAAEVETTQATIVEVGTDTLTATVDGTTKRFTIAETLEVVSEGQRVEPASIDSGDEALLSYRSSRGKGKEAQRLLLKVVVQTPRES